MQQQIVYSQRDIVQPGPFFHGPRLEFEENSECVNKDFKSLGKQSSGKKGFFDTWLWQAVKIGVPVGLGFLMPGIGFLLSTVVTGAASGITSGVEKVATKGNLDSEDKVDILTDFGMGFLGGALAKLPIFAGAKTYFSALIKSAMGGAVSGAAVGGAGQAVKDKINHGEIKEEKILEGTFSGFLGGAAFGGAFGLVGHHLQIRMQRKPPEASQSSPSNVKVQEPLCSLPKEASTKSYEVVNQTKYFTNQAKVEIKEEFNKLVCEIRTKVRDLKNFDPSQQGFQQCNLRSKIFQFQDRLNKLDPNKKEYFKLHSRLNDLHEAVNLKSGHNISTKVPNPEVREIRKDFEKLIQDIKLIIEDPKNKTNIKLFEYKLSSYKSKIWSLQSRLNKIDPKKYNKLRSNFEDVIDIITGKNNCTFDKLSWLQNNSSSSNLPKGFFTAKEGGWDRSRQLNYYLKKSHLYEPPDNPENIAAWAKRLTGKINRLKKIAKSEGEENFVKILEFARQSGYKRCLNKYIEGKGLLTPPQKLSEYNQWAKTLSDETIALKKLFKSLGYGCSEDLKNIFQSGTGSKISASIKKLSEQAASKYFSTVDLQPGSNFRQELSALIRVTRIFDKNYIEGVHPELLLIHLSKPKFALNVNLHSLKPVNEHASKKVPISDLVLRKKETSDSFYEGVLMGIVAFPKKALRVFKQFRYKFIAKHHTSQGRESELGKITPDQFDSRTHYDQTPGLAHFKRRELIISEHMIEVSNCSTNKISTFTDPNTYSQIVAHEGGHGLDRILFTLIWTKKLNRTKTFEEYMNLLQKFKSSGKSDVSNASKKFEAAYMNDISKFSPEQKEKLKYFLYQETPGDYTMGMREVFAEGTCFLHGHGSSEVNFSTFPKTLYVMFKKFSRFIGIDPSFSFHLSKLS